MGFTKIIATVGPSCWEEEVIEKLFEAGVSVFRFNFSHGTHESQREAMGRVKSVGERLGKRYAIMLDTKGPEIRTADLVRPIMIEDGQEIILTVDHGSYEETGKIDVNYDAFVGDVSVGDQIVIDNGTMVFEVTSKNETDVICKVLDGGELKSRRHINLPGVDPSLDTITKKDWEDIAFGLAEKVDFIALSFVRSDQEIHELKKYLKENNASHIKIIAKIESFEATKNLESIIKAADGSMVARGDLGAEVPFQKVPMLQKEIVRLAIYYRKPTIVATQMLESMIHNLIPTRAEVTDVSMAVTQRSDCIMMSGETANGKHPVKATQVMACIGEEIESGFDQDPSHYKVLVDSDKVEFARMASRIIEDNDIEMIVIISKSGDMARDVSAFRPNLPILVGVPEDWIVRQLQLSWGCKGFLVDFDYEKPEITVVNTEKAILEKDPSLNGKKYLLVSEFLEGKQFVPTLQIRILDGKG